MGAESYCSACGAVLAEGYRFCGACGHPTGEHSSVPDSSEPSSQCVVTLVRIQGGGSDGEVYSVKPSGTLIGRMEGDVRFPDDFFMSPRHASIQVDGHRVTIQDEGSQNGVFLRIKGEAVVDGGDVFMAGEEVFRVESISPTGPTQDQEGTQFFGSPASRCTLGLRQLLEGGVPGLLRLAEKGQLSIGRDGCDIDFPNDNFISGTHCVLETTQKGFVLRDLNSRNGTYLRTDASSELQNGDFIFLGRQLLRVDIREAAS